MTETAPEPPKRIYLRDRLLETVTAHEAVRPFEAVEAICDSLVEYLRSQADEWDRQAIPEMDMYGRGAAVLCRGLADGIERARPEVSPQDVGVQSES